MAISTHRWRPSANVISGYSYKKKHKKSKYSKNKEHCFIEMKFENSPYFAGVHHPLNNVYQISKIIKKSSIRLERQSSITFNESLGHTLFKKLYASEYVEGKTVHSLTKLNDPLVRAFIVSEDPSYFPEALSIIEIMKMELEAEAWRSFKLIIVSKFYDMKHGILKRHVPVFATKQFVIKVDKKDEEEDMEDDEDLVEHLDLEQSSTGTMFDEDDETRMIGSVASSKYRDSRIIITNKIKHATQPNMDPIERCFLVMTKMMEDNIFSTMKGLSELNMQIEKMIKDNELNKMESNSSNSLELLKI